MYNNFSQFVGNPMCRNSMSSEYSSIKTSDKKRIAKSLYGTTYYNLDSWLRCCTDLRNICAHYGRLYYRIFSAIPATPDGFPIRLGRRLFDNIEMLSFLYPDRDKWNNEVLLSIIACNGVQREHNKKLNNGLPILHKVPPKRDYGRYFCIMAEKGGTSHGGLTEKLSLFFHAKKQEVNAYGR